MHLDGSYSLRSCNCHFIRDAATDDVPNPSTQM